MSASDHWLFPGWRSLGIALGAGCASPLLAYAVTAVWPWHSSNHQLSRTALIVMAVTLPFFVFFEEWLFRGVILRLLVRRVGSIGAVLISSALFSVAHFALAGAAGRFVGGIVLGWLYLRTRNLWACMAAHFVHNAVVFTIVFVNWV